LSSKKKINWQQGNNEFDRQDVKFKSLWIKIKHQSNQLQIKKSSQIKIKKVIKNEKGLARRKLTRHQLDWRARCQQGRKICEASTEICKFFKFTTALKWKRHF
jgi:hypothetical protein